MMNKTVDAKVFFLSPSEKDRKRIENLIGNELCEAFVIEDPSLSLKLLPRLEKCILVIDSETYGGETPLERYVPELVEACGIELIRVFVVADNRLDFNHEKVYVLDRATAGNNEKIISLIDELQIWGERSYIRFGNHTSRIAYFRMKFGSQWRTGVIHDISASGMSCSFDRFEDIDVVENSTAIELRINESIFQMTGNFLIRRTFKTSNTFVIVFSSRRGAGYIKSLNSLIFKLARDQILRKMEKLVS